MWLTKSQNSTNHCNRQRNCAKMQFLCVKCCLLHPIVFLFLLLYFYSIKTQNTILLIISIVIYRHITSKSLCFYCIAFIKFEITKLNYKCGKICDWLYVRLLTVKISSLWNFSLLWFTSKNERENSRIWLVDFLTAYLLCFRSYVDSCVKAFKRILFLYVCKDLYYKFSWSWFLSNFNNEKLIRETKILCTWRSSPIIEKCYFLCESHV